MSDTFGIFNAALKYILKICFNFEPVAGESGRVLREVRKNILKKCKPITLHTGVV